MKLTVVTLRKLLKQNSNPEKAVVLSRFFKACPGEYGEGDKFYGITVPELRKIARQYQSLMLEDLKILIYSEYHEERMLALLILMSQYKKSEEEKERKKIYDFYLKNMQQINNWDLVDLSAPHIVGHYLFEKDRTVLYRWAENKNFWIRRIGMLSTFYFIRQNEFEDTLKIADILLQDNEDLIHKAVGWLLREVGKRDESLLEKFLKPRYQKMPRTMLRYAIEKFSESKRRFYLEK